MLACFFFSSRRRHTRCGRDWSSDVCSSDLASINPVDGHLLRGALLMRPITGLRKPKNTRFGGDFAGVVEAVGKNVTNFKPGDEVFGAKNGAVADYICVNADRGVVMKPSNVTFEQAGSVAIAALTALQGLR